jgi:hypothetical protein
MGLQITQQRNTEAAIPARLIQSVAFEPEDVERINLLAAQARDGDMAPEDEAELDSYLHVGNLLTIMQSKARVCLKTHESSALPQ